MEKLSGTESKRRSYRIFEVKRSPAKPPAILGLSWKATNERRCGRCLGRGRPAGGVDAHARLVQGKDPGATLGSLKASGKGREPFYFSDFTRGYCTKAKKSMQNIHVVDTTFI